VSKKTYLISVCLISTLGGFLFGYDTAVISGTLTFVRSQFDMSPLLEGWFVGSALLGCVIGVGFAGIIADRFGRKLALIISSILLLVSAAGCMIAGDLTSLILYRLVGGLGVGVASMVSPLFISEISWASIRGRMVSLYQLAITIGIFFAYLANAQILAAREFWQSADGGFVQWVLATEVWRGMFGSEAVPGLFFLALLFFVPETPRWLMARGREEKAFSVLRRIVSDDAARSEVEEIRKVIREETGSWKQLLQPGIRGAILIGMALAILSQFSGINAVIYYGPRIFETAGFGVGGSLDGQVIIGIVNVLFTFVAIWKIDQLGRRALLIIGCIGMTAAHLVIGTLFYTGHTGGILLLIFIPTFTAFFAFSYGPVIWTLLSELYPTKVRGRAMSVATLTLWVGTFIIGQTVPWMLENLKPYGTFWLFSIMLIPAILITWKLVPETKGRTLEDIERYWLKKGGETQPQQGDSRVERGTKSKLHRQA
jgi:MFS transporter, SP family, arabinose:H+ symporter